jgi:hypothetical protein
VVRQHGPKLNGYAFSSVAMMSNPGLALSLCRHEGPGDLPRQFVKTYREGQFLVLSPRSLYPRKTPRFCDYSVDLANLKLADVAWVAPIKATRTPGQHDLPVGISVVGEGVLRSNGFKLSNLEWIDRLRPVDGTPAIQVALPNAFEGRHALWAGHVERFRSLSEMAPLGTWVWASNHWQQSPQRIFKTAQALSLRTLYISVPVDMDTGEVEQKDLLKRFIAQADERGLDVWVVLAEPTFVNQEIRPSLIRRIAAIKRYQSQVPPASRLVGMQLDIEPHLLPGYAQQPSMFHARLVDTMREVKQALGDTPVDLCLPFWNWDRPAGSYGPLLEALTPWVDRITVMDYTTKPSDMTARMAPFLAWGERHNKDVVMALELAPLPDEGNWRLIRTDVQPQVAEAALAEHNIAYQMFPWLSKQAAPSPSRPAASRLSSHWLVPLNGHDYALLTLKQPLDLAVGSPLEARGLAPNPIPASMLTFFHGRQYFASTLETVLPNLTQAPAFRGVTLHYYDFLNFFMDNP